MKPQPSGAAMKSALAFLPLFRALVASVPLAIAGLLSLPAQAAVILLGTDYFETVQPTFFTPLDGLGMGILNPLRGLPIGPGTTDTKVQRQANCTLDLTIAGTSPSCTNIPIEMVALSLVSTVNPMVVLRETPGSVVGLTRSGGFMTITSDGLGSGGTFISSFFDVFVELSVDGGTTFNPFANVPLSSDATPWTIIEPLPPVLPVPGSIGDQNTNLHTNKHTPDCQNIFGTGATCEDFYLVAIVQEQHPGVGLHSAKPAQVPEPATLALLGAGLGILAFLRKRMMR